MLQRMLRTQNQVQENCFTSRFDGRDYIIRAEYREGELISTEVEILGGGTTLKHTSDGIYTLDCEGDEISFIIDESASLVFVTEDQLEAYEDYYNPEQDVRGYCDRYSVEYEISSYLEEKRGHGGTRYSGHRENTPWMNQEELVISRARHLEEVRQEGLCFLNKR